MCVGCREMKEKRELIRIVRTPEGETLIDPTGKKSGRGAYVCRLGGMPAARDPAETAGTPAGGEPDGEVTEALKAEMDRLATGGAGRHERAEELKGNAGSGVRAGQACFGDGCLQEADQIRKVRDDPAGRGDRAEHPEEVRGAVRKGWHHAGDPAARTNGGSDRKEQPGGGTAKRRLCRTDDSLPVTGAGDHRYHDDFIAVKGGGTNVEWRQ